MALDKRRSTPVLRSLSPSSRFPSQSMGSSSSSAFASSTSLGFSSPSFFGDSSSRSGSPTRLNLFNSSSQFAPNFKFSINRSVSPSRSISVANQKSQHQFPKKTCMCSPTTHPGSFRCSLHKKAAQSQPVPYTPMRLNMVRSAMKNSLVRIGGVEGEWVKRALTALIRPSSHQQRRRVDFQPRPSRLSVMLCAGDC